MLSVEDRLIVKAAATLDLAFALKYGRELGAVGDYETTGLVITNFSNEVPEGDAIFIDATGTVTDKYAGFPDAWQIAAAAAVVDSNGNPDPTLRTYYVIKSRDYFYNPTLVLRSPFQDHVHLWFTPMPSHTVSVRVKLFANHDDRPEFDWAVWDEQSTVGWDRLDMKELAIKNPAKAPNWLLIGGGVMGLAVVVLLVTTLKK